MLIIQLSICCGYSYVTNSNLPNVRWFYLYVYSVLNHHFSICVLTVDTMYRTSCLNIKNKMYISLAGWQWRHMREYIYRLIKYISIYTWRVYDVPSLLLIINLNNSLKSILGLFIVFFTSDAFWFNFNNYWNSNDIQEHCYKHVMDKFIKIKRIYTLQVGYLHNKCIFN